MPYLYKKTFDMICELSYQPTMSTCMVAHSAVLSFVYNRVCIRSNTTGVKCGEGTVYPSEGAEFIICFSRGSCCSIFNFCVVFCTCSFVFLSIFCWSLYFSFLWYTFSYYHFDVFKLFYCRYAVEFKFLLIITHQSLGNIVQIYNTVGTVLIAKI